MATLTSVLLGVRSALRHSRCCHKKSGAASIIRHHLQWSGRSGGRLTRSGLPMVIPSDALIHRRKTKLHECYGALEQIKKRNIIKVVHWKYFEGLDEN